MDPRPQLSPHKCACPNKHKRKRPCSDSDAALKKLRSKRIHLKASAPVVEDSASSPDSIDSLPSLTYDSLRATAAPLLSPVELALELYDPDFGLKVCRLYHAKVQMGATREVWRQQRYGWEIAHHFICGETPDAYRAERDEWEEEQLRIYEAELDDTDSEHDVEEALHASQRPLKATKRPGASNTHYIPT